MCRNDTCDSNKMVVQNVFASVLPILLACKMLR